jgi:prepilin-type processing-associated H-X9-DG protein
MKKPSLRGATRAFTLLELILVIATGALLFLVWAPTANRPRRSPSVVCMNQLRTTTVSLMIWSSDHANRLPWAIEPPDSMNKRVLPLHYFEQLAGFSLNPSTLICPTEKTRRSAADFRGLTNNNLSYFLNTDSNLTNQPISTILLGDRHLALNGKQIAPGAFQLVSDPGLGWSPTLHKNAGAMGFADGHTEFVRTRDLSAKVNQQPRGTNLLFVP